MNRENHLRSIVKGVTWRIIGTLDTILLSYIYTQHAITALQIGGVEVFTKIGLYWLHERIWLSVKYGLKYTTVDGKPFRKESHSRSVIKGVTWRAIGSLDTFLIALLVNHNSPTATKTAFYISATEVITKIGLYWLHERAWMGVKWGKKVQVLAL